ncbi:hypothetical protein [Streptomyces albidochromogenes]|nr:hypothetical protein [Streptomyces albidochromogenes]
MLRAARLDYRRVVGSGAGAVVGWLPALAVVLAVLGSASRSRRSQ